MCDHENREAAMTVVRPGIWCDPCIAPLIQALNDGGLPTIASCCGHDHAPTRITLTDGRTLMVLTEKQHQIASTAIHAEIGCKPGRECDSCADHATPDTDGSA